MIDVIAAANAAVKLGSAVIAAVAALTVSARDGCGPDCAFGCANWAPSASCDTCSPENLEWLLYKAWPKTCGSDGGCCGGCGTPNPDAPPAVLGKLGWNCAGGSGGFWSWRGLGLCVRSNVTVGNGADADIVAMLDEQGSMFRAKKFEFISPSALDIEPDRSIVAAADVVDAIATAAGGNGWL